jgi:hypothetical protein
VAAGSSVTGPSSRRGAPARCDVNTYWRKEEREGEQRPSQGEDGRASLPLPFHALGVGRRGGPCSSLRRIWAGAGWGEGEDPPPMPLEHLAPDFLPLRAIGTREEEGARRRSSTAPVLRLASALSHSTPALPRCASRTAAPARRREEREREGGGCSGARGRRSPAGAER